MYSQRVQSIIALAVGYGFLFLVGMNLYASDKAISKSPTRADVEKMSPSQAVAALDVDGKDWQTWCSVVTYASTTTLLADDNVRQALIGLISKLNSISEQWYKEYDEGKNPQGLDSQYGEGYGECWGEITMRAVPLLRRDKRALGALIRAHIPYAVVDFGDEAVQPVLDAYNTPGASSARRAAMVEMLGQLSAKGIHSVELRAKAKETVFQATDDRSLGVRKRAVKNLRFFGRDEALKKLRDILKKDQYSFIRKKDKKQIFPIREAAQKEIEQLTKKPDEKQ